MRSDHTMEMLGRLAAALGTSLVLTLLMMVFYQDHTPSRATRAQAPANAMTDSR